MPKITTEETRWLQRLVKFTRLAASASSGVSPYIVQFTIGDGNPGTPTDGSTDYLNPLFNGKSTIKVSKNGVGYLTEGVDYDLVSGGGITLLGGALFSTDETYVIWAY